MESTMTDDELLLVAKWRRKAASGFAREVRIAARVTASEIARQVGVSHTAVHYWERGRVQQSKGSGLLAWSKLMERLTAAAEADGATHA